MVLYPDEDEAHAIAFQRIKESFDYVAIRHDPDDEEGKDHYHLIVKFPNPKWNTAFADELGIPQNYIRKLGSFDAYSVYMLHADERSQDSGKKLYSLDDMSGNLLPDVAKALRKYEKSKTTEDERIIELIDLIYSIDRTLTYTQLIRLAAANNLYGEFRKAGYSMKMVWEEHNNEIYAKAYNNRSDDGDAT